MTRAGLMRLGVWLVILVTWEGAYRLTRDRADPQGTADCCEHNQCNSIGGGIPGEHRAGSSSWGLHVALPLAR